MNTTSTTPTVTVETETAGTGTERIVWRIGDYRGLVRPGRFGGWLGESEHVLALDSSASHPTPEAAAMDAYRLEIAVGPALLALASKYRIEHPEATFAVYAIAGNPYDLPVGRKPEGRFVNLSPWERAAVGIARSHRSMSVSVNDGDITQVRLADGGRTALLTRTPAAGGAAEWWQVVDGCRRVRLV